MEGFVYTSSIYINIGYLHIDLFSGDKYLFTAALPRGKYKEQKLTLGVCNSLDTFPCENL